MFKANPELKAKLEEILKNNDTENWVDSLNSESTGLNYPKHVAEFLIYRKISIKQFISNFKKDSVTETKQIQAFVNHLLKKLTASTTANYVSALKNRLDYDQMELKHIRVPKRHLHPTVEDEVIPTKSQIITFLQNANPSSQAIITLMAFLGIRFNVIGDLRVSDFPEMQITENDVIFEKIPTRVKIRRELSKNKKEYQTFLVEFGCGIIKNWLKVRMEKGEKLNSNSLIIPTYSETDSLRKRANYIARRLYTVFEKMNYNARPYSLKDYFATALLNSGIQQGYQTFFMGHTGPVQNTYSLQRKLPAEQIEKMRTIFKQQIEPHLIPQESDANKIVNHHFKEFAKHLGIEVKEGESTEETISEIADLYKNAIEDVEGRENSQIKTKQKRIPEKELDKYLDDDWEVSHILNSGNIIVKKLIN